MTAYLVTTTYITQLNEPFILMFQSYFKFHYRCIKFMCKSANETCKRLHIGAEQKRDHSHIVSSLIQSKLKRVKP